MKKEECLKLRTKNEIMFTYGFNNYKLTSTYDSLLSFIKHDKQISEYISPSTPLNLFFDLDYNLEEGMDREQKENQMVELISVLDLKTKDLFKEKYHVLMGVARSDGRKKLSAHVIFRLRDRKTNILTVFPDISLLKNFIKTHFEKMDIDRQVYRLKGGLFRCLNQSKPKDLEKRIFRIDASLSNPALSIKDFFICYCEETFDFLENDLNTVPELSPVREKAFKELGFTGSSAFSRGTVTDLSICTLGSQPDSVLVSDCDNMPVYRATALALRCPVHNKPHRSNRSILTVNMNEVMCSCFDEDKGKLFKTNTKEVLGEARYNLLFNRQKAESNMLEFCRKIDPGVHALEPTNGGYEAKVSESLDRSILPSIIRTSSNLYHKLNHNAHIIYERETGKNVKLPNFYIDQLNQQIIINNITVNNGSNSSSLVKKFGISSITKNHELSPLLTKWVATKNPCNLTKFLLKCGFFKYLVFDTCDKFYLFSEGYWTHVNTSYLRSKLMNDIDNYLETIINESNTLKDEEKEILHDRLGLLMTKQSFGALFDVMKAQITKPLFASVLDTKRNLVPFSNGVYDLKHGIFRDSCPDDMLAMHTGYPYNEDISTDLALGVLTPIFPCQEELNYVICLLARMLNPTTPNDSLIFFTGTGSNGKSILFALIKASLGPLSADVPSNIFSNKENTANTAQPHLLALKNKRVALLSEPSVKTFNSGTVKKLCGNEYIAARALFSNEMERIQAFAHFIVATNEIPEFSTQDEAIWRRIQIVCFNQKFVNNPTKSNEKLADPCLVENIRVKIEYSQSFIKLLLKHVNEPLPSVPNSFSNAKSSEESMFNTFNDWLQNNLILCEGSVLTCNEISKAYLESKAGIESDKTGSQTLKAQLRGFMFREFPNIPFKVHRIDKSTVKRGWTGVGLLNKYI